MTKKIIGKMKIPVTVLLFIPYVLSSTSKSEVNPDGSYALRWVISNQPYKFVMTEYSVEIMCKQLEISHSNLKFPLRLGLPTFDFCKIKVNIDYSLQSTRQISWTAFFGMQIGLWCKILYLPMNQLKILSIIIFFSFLSFFNFFIFAKKNIFSIFFQKI